MGIEKIKVEDTELQPSQLFNLTQAQMQQLENLNYQISQIELKISWVWENSREQATRDGWFDDAYHNLSMAKEAKTQFVNTLK
jgi:hypothetical protein